MPLFNVFSDPVLAARQAQLDGQWKALLAVINGCDNFPGSAWVEFVNDKMNWEQFYDTGSDWSSDSKKATDSWQLKLQAHAAKVDASGCRGSVGSVGGVDVAGPISGIPGIGSPPDDEPGWFSDLVDTAVDARDKALSPIATVGWVAVGLVVLILGAIVWVATKGRISGPGGVGIGG